MNSLTCRIVFGGVLFSSVGFLAAQAARLPAGANARYPVSAQDEPASLALAPDGKTLAVGCARGGVYMVDVTTGQLVATLPGNIDIRWIAWNPRGTGVVAVQRDGRASVWDVASKKSLRVLGDETRSVRCAAYSPDGTVLATGGGNGSLCLWDATTGELRSELRGHKNLVSSVAFDATGKVLVSGGFSDDTIRLWDVATRKETRSFRGIGNVNELGIRGGTFPPDSYPICSIAISPRGDKLVVGVYDGTACVWDMKAGKELFKLGADRTGIQRVALSPDGSLLASCGPVGVVRVWDMESGREAAKFEIPGHRLTAVTFLADGKTLATGCSDSTVLLWKLPVK